VDNVIEILNKNEFAERRTFYNTILHGLNFEDECKRKDIKKKSMLSPDLVLLFRHIMV
jgi:hypothetical protein